jgi:hypothetical protein
VQIFSQIASLDLRGALRFGPLTFFKKYDQDASPRPSKKKVAQTRNRKSKRSHTHRDRKPTATSAAPKKLTGMARKQKPRRRTWPVFDSKPSPVGCRRSTSKRTNYRGVKIDYGRFAIYRHQAKSFFVSSDGPIDIVAERLFIRQ